MLLGGHGQDTLYGGQGNDTLIGNQGDDVMDGGEGSDLYMIEGNDVLQDSGTGSGDFDRAQIASPLGMAVTVGGWIGIERVSGFRGDDTIDASDVLTTISLQGADGNDLLIGGAGHDMLFGGNGHDQLIGGDGNDMLLGGPGQDSLFGGAGNDTLIGNQGADLMDGGEGSDVYMIEGADTIFDSGTSVADFDRAQISNPGGIALAVGHWTGVERINGFTGNDTIDASGAELSIILDGGAGHDLLIGSNGHDTLIGGAGDDRLIAGAGNDYLAGGAGADLFVFNNGFGHDMIADFLQGTDRIELRFHDLMDDFGSLAISQHQNNALISAEGSRDTIVLVDVMASALTADDFIFF
jgi:Ca2+-binding RTX toxin-like protein